MVARVPSRFRRVLGRAGRAARPVRAVSCGAVPVTGGRSAGELAAGAFFAAGAGDRAGALRAVRALDDAGALTWAMGRWADTLVSVAGSRGGPVPGAPARGGVAGGGRAGPGGTRAADLWADWFLAARARADRGACGRLIAAIPPGSAPQYALSLVESVSARLREVRPGLGEESHGSLTDQPGEVAGSWEYPARVGTVKRGLPLGEAEKLMFGRRVAAWQALHGLEPGELALWLGMSRFRLSRIKNNLLTRMTRDEAVHIAVRLGMRASGTAVECTVYSEEAARQARELFAGQAEIEGT